MKKPIYYILAGIIVCILLIAGIVFALSMKPVNENTPTQKPDATETESVFEEINKEEMISTETEIEEIVTETETEESTEEPPEIVQKPVDAPYYIRINRLANCVTVYAKDVNGNYTVPVRAMICSVGLTDETPLGVHTIYARYQWRPLFGGTYGQYAIRFKGTYLFHSVPYTQQSKDSLKEGQFNMLGEPASQGCVRLMAIDAKWIYDNCINGTKVEVYDSPDPGPLGKPVAYKISENSPYKGWDPTDPDPANPWKQGTVSITGVRDITVNQGETADLKKGVSAKDVDGLPLEVTVDGKVDWNTPGKYVVTYNATGVLGMVATTNATVTVNAVQPPEPEEPVEPEQPEVPETPEEPETPVEPDSPEEPETPTTPETPEDTETPVEPDSSEETPQQ